MLEPSEDDKVQFRQDFPCMLRNAPRLGAVSQFTQSPDRFTMIRPEVEVRVVSPPVHPLPWPAGGKLRRM